MRLTTGHEARAPLLVPTLRPAGLAAGLRNLLQGMHCEYLLSFGYPARPGGVARPARPSGRKPAESSAVS